MRLSLLRRSISRKSLYTYPGQGVSSSDAGILNSLIKECGWIEPVLNIYQVQNNVKNRRLFRTIARDICGESMEPSAESSFVLFGEIESVTICVASGKCADKSITDPNNRLFYHWIDFLFVHKEFQDFYLPWTQDEDMRCVVPGRSLKLFAKSIHCLSKIGDELYLEALSDGLALRTVNLSRSAYACFKFHSSFFLSYDDGSKDLQDESQAEDMLKCKISMKSCLIVFKSVSSLDRNVDRCKIDLNVHQGRLVFLLYCRHGITKTHNLTFQECETLQAVFTKDLCPNFMTAQPKVLSDTVSNFPNNLEELTLSVTPDATVFKNYTEDEPDPNKVIHTQMNLSPEEFDNYQIGIDTDITFCLKELRAILAFGEVANQPLNVHFETGGKPIVFSMDTNSTYEADFVLATLVDEPQSSQASQAPSVSKPIHCESLESYDPTNRLFRSSSQQSKVENKQSAIDKPKTSQSNNTISRKRVPAQSQSRVARQQSTQEKKGPLEDETLVYKEETKREGISQNNSREKLTSQQQSQVLPNQQKAKKLSIIPESSQEIPSQGSLNTTVNPLNTPHSCMTDTSFLNKIDMPSVGYQSPSSQQFQRNVIKTESLVHEHKHASDSDEDMDDDDGILPGTPPTKKFKSMFFGLHSQKKLEATKGTVLAADTDDEDSD